MLFLRREVVAPGSAPLTLPVGAVEAGVGTDEVLAALPNPFRVGAERPPSVNP